MKSLNTVTYQAPLSNDIVRSANRLVDAVNELSNTVFQEKSIMGTSGMVSVADIIAYQIGWATLLLGWYRSGLTGESVVMPGDGFTTWDYVGLAQHFYKQYQYDDKAKALQVFQTVVQEIISFVEVEYVTGNLEKEGVWSWCTLASGKKWPLSKWVQVNTVAPYKRALVQIRKVLK